MRKEDVKKFWQAQRAKERKQLKPFAEKIVKAVVKCAEECKKEESVNNEIDKLRSNFNYQLEREGFYNVSFDKKDYRVKT